MLRYSRTATFLDVLGLLVENQTPLPEAIILAAEASGDPQTLRSARQVAKMLTNGQTAPPAEKGWPAFPPMINWLLSAAGRDGALLPALRHAAAAYHRRARHQSDMLRLFLPVFLTIAVGGSVTALYALSLFIPYTAMLRALGR
jgi:type II secretory pathway component PulF